MFQLMVEDIVGDLRSEKVSNSIAVDSPWVIAHLGVAAQTGRDTIRSGWERSCKQNDRAV